MPNPNPVNHQRISVCLPPELVAQLDELALPKKRSAVIVELLQRQLNPWTPASQPPEKSGDYICWVTPILGEPFQDYVHYSDKKKRWTDPEGGEVSHWMPRPSPPA